MPDDSLSVAIKEAYASAPSDDVILHTIELRHASFATPIRVVRDHIALSATLESDAPENPGETVTFVAFAFNFRLPDANKTTVPEIEITIDNASAELIGYLDVAAQTADMIELTYRPYLASDTSAPQMDPPITLVVREINCDVFRVVARAGFGDLANKRYPSEIYTSERFPGLFA